ncbi:MAG: hypothetical protein AAB249_04590 [Acidobacteriota bacterium]|mgnify:FL=1
MRFRPYPEERTAEVAALTIGCARDLPRLRDAATALGAALTVYRFDDRLEPAYGERPVSEEPMILGLAKEWRLRRHLMKHDRERKKLEARVLELEDIKRSAQEELKELEHHEKLWNSVQLDE